VPLLLLEVKILLSKHLTAKLILSPCLSIAVGNVKLQSNASANPRQGILSGVPIGAEKIGGVLRRIV